MLVKDVILKSCQFTENQTLASQIQENNVLEEETQTLNNLIECFNNVCNEVFSEYVAMIKTEVVCTENFKVSYSDLSNKMIKIISVCDENGRKVKFKLFSSYIFVLAKKVEICYQFVPDEMTINSSIDTFVPARVFAYGVARDYFANSSSFSEAQIWEDRFKNSLTMLQNKKSETIIPCRRWI